MKKYFPKLNIYILFILGLFQFPLFAQTSTRNFVRETVYKSKTGNLSDPSQSQSTITYLDGLGRPVQTVAVFQGGKGEDIVSHISYDEFGRDNIKYAPYPVEDSNGIFRPLAPAEASSNLGGDVRPFNQTIYEPSPLNRVLKQGGVGSAWSLKGAEFPDDNSVKLKYSTNGTREVKRFDATNSNGTGGTDGTTINGGLYFEGYYGANQLWVTETLDENNTTGSAGNRTKEYKDKSGRVILKKAIMGDGSSLDTYYIYDDFGQLRAVFPPLLSPTLINDGVAFTPAELTNIEELTFLYAYDTEGRMRDKKVPGVKKVTMTYDLNTDLLLSTTDGKNQTINYTYDALNRVIKTSVGTEWLTKTYYDGTNPDWATTAGSDYPVDLSAKIGMVTGGETRRIDENNNYGDPIVSRIYYDSRYRPVKTYKNYRNLITGGMVEEVMMERSYIGTVLKEKTVQSNGMDNFTILKTYQYDHSERLLSICHRITEKTSMKTREEVPHLLNWLTYDGLGRLSRKSLGKLPLKYLKKEPNYEYAETQYFDYNIRNALTLSKGYRLLNKNSYGTPEAGKQNFRIDLSYTADGQFNGNIGKYTWDVNGDAGGFNLVYDGINRLLSAKNAGAYWDEELAYDKNGNITNLKRWRRGGGMVDDLKYDYANAGLSNQLLQVKDDATVSNKNEGYNNTNANATDFAYDNNGNLTQDDDKSILANGIEYNVLNLVKKVTGSGGIGQKYTWDGAGMKLRYMAGGTNKVYIGGVEYANNTNGQLAASRIQTEEGHILQRQDWTENDPRTKYVYYYTLSDHLGNARIVMNDDQDAEVVQSNSYSAFGLLALGPDGTASKFNNRFYNGKEKQEGTGWLDYGARMYYSEIGRWMSVDPSHEDGGQESTSPYGYVFGNPVKLIDPDGRLPELGDVIKQVNNYVSNTTQKFAQSLVRATGNYINNKISETADKINETLGQTNTTPLSIQEGGGSYGLNAKLGPVSVAMSIDVGAGRAADGKGINNSGVESVVRGNFSITGSGKDLLGAIKDPKKFTDSGFSLKAGGYLTLADKPTAISEQKSSTSAVGYAGVGIIGNGLEGFAEGSKNKLKLGVNVSFGLAKGGGGALKLKIPANLNVDLRSKATHTVSTTYTGQN